MLVLKDEDYRYAIIFIFQRLLISLNQ